VGAVWFRFRTELRTRWRSWFVLALLVALGAGVVMAAVAGARRTDSAYSRFLDSQRADDVIVINGAGVFGFANLDLAKVAALPGVEVAGTVELEQAAGVVRKPGSGLSFETITPVSDPDGGYGNRFDRPKILEGRRPNPDRPLEIAPSFAVAERLGLQVGDRLRMRFYAPEEGSRTFIDLREVRGPLVTFHVVGISAAPGDFPPINGYDVLHLTPAFDARYGSQIFRTQALGVRLTHGAAGVPAFKHRVERLADGAVVQFLTQRDNAQEVQRSIHVQAVTLYLLAGLAGVIALLVIAQAVSRQTYIESDDDATLVALGFGRRQLGAAAVLRLALIAVLGAGLATALAVALSPLTPAGFAGKAEPDPGFAVDGVALALGAVLTVLFVVSVGLVASLRTSRLGNRARVGSGRPSRIVGSLASLGAPPTVVVGVRMAVTRGRGRGAVPVWTTVAGGVFAIATVVGAVGFAASLDHLLATPRLYGVAWDITVGDTYAPDLSASVAPFLRSDPAVRGVAGGTYAEVEIDDRVRVPALATKPISGDVTPTILEGHAPSSPAEVVLGTTTLDELDAHIGSSVVVGRGTHQERFRVVGRGVLPDLGNGGLGRGAAMTEAGLRRIVRNAAENYYLVQTRRGVEPTAFADRLERELGTPGLVERHPSAPTDLVNYARVDNLPFVIAGLLVLMATATLAHTLVSQVRRRRRDLAVLKTLGFERGQVLATTAWQASTLAVTALLVGIPLGLLAGRLAWRAFANQLGVVFEARIPWIPIVVLVPAALVLANLVAAVPARAAARTRPATVLRSE
jgi:hypothetical protein